MGTHLTTDLTADQLGWIINDAFDDVNDIGGMNEACWALVAKRVAEALKLRLNIEEGE
jgi:hypothetical protein